MCGVGGYFGHNLDPAEAPAILASMNLALSHRGPDGAGIHIGRGAGLAHTRLSIVGLADGAQPMPLPEAGLWISFNGEVFNHVELRAMLEARGRRFRTSADTEVILHLYAEMGLGCLDLLNGDFAFAIWDERARRMVLARDRMGVRPLFYAESRGTLFFASEAKALLGIPGIEAEMDPFALDQVFTLWAPTPPRTAFRNISELPPAHAMTIDRDGASVRRYWDIPFPDARHHAPDQPAAETAEELLHLLDDATRLRLRADVPVGAYLSGGLDSSIVCALAARSLPGTLDTFSVTFDSAEHDESLEQALVARALGTRHASVACGPCDISADFPAVVRHAERPLLRTGPAPLYRLSRLVRERGMKVVLTGEGADEVLAGYDIFKEDRVRRFCARDPGSSLRPRLLGRLYRYLPGLAVQGPGSLAAFFNGGDGPDAPLHAHGPRFRNTSSAKLLFSGDLRATLAGYEAAEELAGRLPSDFMRWHPLHRAQYVESTCLLPDYILSSQGDRMAMAHGIEGRFPFLDHRLVEFAARLPPQAKLKGPIEKHVLRQASLGLVPPAIARRGKQPYRAPDSASFRGPETPAYVAQMLAPGAVAATGLFNPAGVARLAERCARSPRLGFRDNAAFVGVLSTQLWHRAFARVPAETFHPAETESVP